MKNLVRPALRALGALAFSALIATSLPGLSRSAGAAGGTPAAAALDRANIDPTCRACDDFYQYATGGWSKHTAMPAGHPRWGSFDELAQRNRDELHVILEDAAKTSGAATGSDEQKLGSFYRSCMDTAGIERADRAPIASLLTGIAAVGDVPGLVHEIAALQQAGVDVGLPLSSRADIKNSARQIANLGFGGLGLPDRDYYFNDDERSKTIRAAYHGYVAAQLQNLGPAAGDPAAAAGQADAVIALETALAQATPRRADLRDPQKLYNPTPVAQLGTIAPHLPWPAYFTALGSPAFDTLNISLPAFVQAYDAQLAATPLETWKSYLRYRLADAYATVLPQRFEDASFAFRSGTLLGVKEQLPRWQRCTTLTDASLRDVLGKVYVTRAFSPAAKARALALVTNLQGVLRDDIRGLDWMSQPTRVRAVAKLDAFTKKIGYPDRWEDYSSLPVSDGALALNVARVRRWNDARTLARIGSATDRGRWGMTPPTVNAYYNSSNDEIVFPAGILQPPFFNQAADDAVNYGAVGAVIGHEMTHGFDDQGRQFDEHGNLSDWWTPADAAAFKTRAQCIVDEFSGFESVPGTHLQGRLVQGEAIADLGGLTIAYKAFERTAQFKAHQSIDGYTPEQRFFLAYAQVWRSMATEGYIRQLAATDPHPFDRFRVIGTLSNMPQFQHAFACAATAAMVRPNRCQIW